MPCFTSQRTSSNLPSEKKLARPYASANFQRLKAGLLDRLHVHTATLTEFLRRTAPGLTKLVLLDHMDWLSHAQPQALADEWTAILAKASPGARVIFRSAAPHVESDRLDRGPA